MYLFLPAAVQKQHLAATSTTHLLALEHLLDRAGLGLLSILLWLEAGGRLEAEAAREVYDQALLQFQLTLIQ